MARLPRPSTPRRLNFGDYPLDKDTEWRHDAPYGVLSLLELFEIFQHAMLLDRARGLRLDLGSRWNQDPVPEELRIKINSMRGELDEEAKVFGLDAVRDLIAVTQHRLRPEETVKKGAIATDLDSIDSLFRMQCSKLKFLRLTKEESNYLDNPSVFGSDVATAFCSDDTQYEIREVGNCLALSRYTACVFHLMRVLERGLRALANNLGVEFKIPFEFLNWQNIIEPIEGNIRDLEKQKPGQQKTEQLKAYSEVAKQFRYFKDAWRNHVAHSRETYQREEAMSIMRHVGEFMRDLAKLGLSES